MAYIYRKLSRSDIELLVGRVDGAGNIRRTTSELKAGYLVGRLDMLGHIYSGRIVGRVDGEGKIYRTLPESNTEQLVGRVGATGRIYRIIPESNTEWLVGRTDSSNPLLIGGAALLLLLT
jgi:hypothetical protein